MTDQITLTTLAEVSDEQRAEFYSAVFESRAPWLAQHWRWWYRVGAFPGVEPVAAMSGRRMIGQAGVIPVMIEIGTRRELATWFVDFAIRPELQRHGLGKRLTEAWMGLAPLRVTFCNKRSMGIFRRYGWSERFDNARCGILLRPERLLSERFNVAGRALGALYRVAIRPITARAPRLEPEEIGTIPSFEKDADVRIVRDSAWASWRLTSGPFAPAHRAFRLGKAFAVVRGVLWNGHRRIHLLVLTGGTARDRVTLVRGIVRWALGAEIDLIWTAPVDAQMRKELRSVLPLQRRLRFAAFADDPELMQALTRGRVALQPCDSDADLFYTPDSPGEFAWR